MRFALALAALAIVAYAAPRGDRLARAEKMRERVRKAITFLQQAKSYGEFAINTPTGLYPVGDITADNLPDVFRFRREFEELKRAEQTQIKSIMAKLDSPAVATTTVAASHDIEGSGVEGSGLEDKPKKTTPKKGEKKGNKRESPIEEPLLTGDSQSHGPITWAAAPGKFEASRV
uniref:Uncharacterized protein n=1 Tax=Pristionchus pacificus TaxID=54126 RepID=A0A2A6B7F2_PRIPA|eukprot:PDM61783.1 hypothetical protein PRIPAC_51225 [Pristionchus pacificus]